MGNKSVIMYNILLPLDFHLDLHGLVKVFLMRLRFSVSLAEMSIEEWRLKLKNAQTGLQNAWVVFSFKKVLRVL